jgi:hypothetical protein
LNVRFEVAKDVTSDKTAEGDGVSTDPTQADEEVVPAPGGDPQGSSGQDIPGKPLSDMDPPGQDEPGGQAENNERSAREGSTAVTGKLPKLRYF